MTPAVLAAKKQGISYQLHEYQHDSKALSYGLEAAEKLALPPERVFKTLVAKLDDKELVVAVLPVSSTLNMKALSKALGGKRATMADKLEVQRSSGYVLGGVSPLGQKKSLRSAIDSSARSFATVFVSAGRRGLEIELAASDLQRLTAAVFAEIVDA